MNNTNADILLRNFKVFSHSEESLNNFKSLIFQLALNGKLDFKKLSNGRINKPLQALIREQKQFLYKEGIPFSMFPDAGQNLNLSKERQTNEKSQLINKKATKQLKKEGIAFQENSDSIYPIVELGETLEKIKYTNKIKKSNFLKNGTFPIIDQSENYIAGYWNNQKDIFKVDRPVIIFGDHTCCFKYIDFDFVLGADGVKIIQPNKQFFPFFLYYLLLNTKIRNLGYSRHFKILKKIKIPLPPIEVQKEIVALMDECVLLETQAKEKSQKQNKFSKSVTCFITQSKNKKEIAYYWQILRRNFKDVLYSENGMKEFKSMVFQLALNGKLDFKKLSNGRINKPLQALIREQKQFLYKEGIPFSMFPDAGQNLKLSKERQTDKKSQLINKKATRQFKKEGIAFQENSDSIYPMVELGNICEIFSGKRPKGGAVKSGILSIGGEHINSNGNFNLMKPKYIPKKFFDQLKKGKLENKDILLVKDGATTGKMGYFDEKAPFKTGAVNEHVFILRSKIKKIEPFYLYQFLRSPKGNARILKFKTGSAQGGINLSIKKLMIPLPPIEVQKEIVALMEYIENTEKQVYKEKSLSIKLSQSLSHIENY